MTPRVRTSRTRIPFIEPLDQRLLMKVIYVDATPPLPSNGASWQFAMPSLTQALAVAAPGDEIRVAAGTYNPSTTDRAATFALKSAVTVRGGYAGYNAPNPDARDTSLHPSILSGEINNADISDNSIHVVTATGVSSTAVLDGFTITAGNANSWASANQERGGGVYISSASPTITNCIITANRAQQYGEGMYVGINSSPAITNCSFSNNGFFGFGSYGGAIYNDNSSPTIAGCTFTGNTVYIGGAAIHNKQSNVAITGCTFTANHSRYAGSAIASEQNSSLTVRFCTFSGNIAELSATVTIGGSGPSSIRDCTFTGNSGDTGGISIMGSAVSIDRCDFIRNTGNYQGGAIRVLNSSSIALSYCRFYGNAGGNQYPNQYNGGGAIFTQSSSALNLYHCEFVGNRASNGGAIMDLGAGGTIARNCTIVANSATMSGGAVFNNASSGNPTRVVNSIVRGNTAPTGAQIAYTSITPDVRYSNVEGGFFPSTASINADAQFLRTPSAGIDATWGTIDDDYGDLRVHFTSPGIDMGNNVHTSPNYPTDIAGQPLFFNFPGANDSAGNAVDMGAHELGMTLALLRVPAGQTIALPAGGHTFVIEHLDLPTGATLDLKDSDIVLPNGDLGSWNGAAYTGISAMLQSGAIITSVGDIGDGATRALGIAEASQVLGISGSETAFWNGVTVNAMSVLVKYTYAGDIDLNGELNGDDYFYLDSHILQSGSVFGYAVGDIDLNGELNGDDYFWLDSNILAAQAIGPI